MKTLRAYMHLFAEADQLQLRNDCPHAVECPRVCKGCELCGYELDADGYCESCREEMVL